MITAAISNYYTQSAWPACNITRGEITTDTSNPGSIFGVNVGAGTPIQFASLETSSDSTYQRFYQHLGCQYFDLIGLFCCIFINIVLCQQISGSHFNPMVTLSLAIAPVMDG